MKKTTVAKYPAKGIYIGRPSYWGNPFVIGKHGNREEVIKKFITYIMHLPGMREAAVKELQGKVLVCYCAPLACHGHVLAAIADGKDARAYLPKG